MSRWRQVRTVAVWEFRRYLKPKQQLASIGIIVVLGLVVTGIARLAARDGPVTVAAIGTDILELESRLPDRFHLQPHEAGETAGLRTRVDAGDLDGLLVIHSTDQAELTTAGLVDWTGDVERALASARRDEMLRRTDMSADSLATILAPPALELRRLDQDPADAGAGAAGAGGERLAVIATVSLMLLGVFMGMGYVFASITGEKQARVTEQVVSAIPTQSMIDGKTLGLMAVSLVGMLTTILGTALFFLILRLIDGSGLRELLDAVPFDLTGSTGVVVLIVLFGLLGLFFWFAFLAAIAALIDDPNSSTRGPLLFVPMLATFAGFLALSDPGSGLVRILSILPPTAPGVMPARLILMSVPPLEIGASLALLAGGVLLLRWVAGRVFRVAMLMYGKEPTWGEVRRWILAP